MDDSQRERLAEDLRSVASQMFQAGSIDPRAAAWRERILAVAWELDPAPAFQVQAAPDDEGPQLPLFDLLDESDEPVP